VCNSIFSYTLVQGNIQIYGLKQSSMLINLICMVHGTLRYTPFDVSQHNYLSNQHICLKWSLPKLICPSLISMRVMTLCRQWHWQLNTLLLWAVLRSRLRMMILLSMIWRMTSEVKEMKIARWTMIVVISVPEILTTIDSISRIEIGWCWKCWSISMLSGKPKCYWNGTGCRVNRS